MHVGRGRSGVGLFCDGGGGGLGVVRGVLLEGGGSQGEGQVAEGLRGEAVVVEAATAVSILLILLSVMVGLLAERDLLCEEFSDQSERMWSSVSR